jgi:hypothetical protein
MELNDPFVRLSFGDTGMQTAPHESAALFSSFGCDVSLLNLAASRFRGLLLCGRIWRSGQCRIFQQMHYISQPLLAHGLEPFRENPKSVI